MFPGVVGWLFTLGNEPEWVLEFERQERRVATEMRKREMEERTVSLRTRFKGSEGAMKLEAFVEKVVAESQARK